MHLSAEYVLMAIAYLIPFFDHVATVVLQVCAVPLTVRILQEAIIAMDSLQIYVLKMGFVKTTSI